ERLPEQMIPSAFVHLPAWPLTASGKIDRSNLPTPGAPTLDSAFVLPRTELERRIATVWREVLGVERVGVHDNFFDLGGHSLLIVRLHSRLRDRLTVDLAVVDLFRFPTVSALAAYLDNARPALDSVIERASQRAERQKLVIDSQRERSAGHTQPAAVAPEIKLDTKDPAR
ncbi:MAG: phosphopantetheine-binding protein, partial [Longimicrobiales bacterium]